MTSPTHLREEIEQHFFKNEVHTDSRLTDDLLALIESEKRDSVVEALTRLETHIELDKDGLTPLYEKKLRVIDLMFPRLP